MPVGDVDVVVLQQGLHGAAQQRREMAGHRRHQQQPRLLRRILLLEMQQRTERGGVGDFLGHLHSVIADHHPVDAVGRAAIGEGGARDQLQRGGEPSEQPVRNALRHQIEIFQRRRGPGPPWRRQVHVVLIGLIHHRHHSDPPPSCAPCNIEAREESNRPPKLARRLLRQMPRHAQALGGARGPASGASCAGGV